MSATRTTLLRVTAASRYYAVPASLRTSLLSQPKPPFQNQTQRAWYAIPPQDKKNDDLGGPYGQEPPDPVQRKEQNR